MVSEYLATGEAVGSHTVATRYSLAISPATVRTVMGELEDEGLLRHQHTSAGRIPTDRGLRLYIDTLLRVRGLSAPEKQDIRGCLDAGPAGELQEILRRVARVLRERSQLAVVVQAPRPKSDAVSHIEFVRLREGQLLAVIASASGQIQNKMIAIEFALSPGDLDRINNYLNSLVAGLTLDQMRRRVLDEISREQAMSTPVCARALELAAAALPATESAGGILLDGQSNLLAEASDLEQARCVLRTLEEKDQIVKLLDRTLAAPGICVFIGAEAKLSDLEDISVVAASYGGEQRPLGTIGVIGPSRMNYSRVIPLVDFTADVITDILPRI